ncbi:ML domain-containing protein [Gorgonomyces haynaldii]|nr:ML domain-containing protein [Gorgonomyces haynaldii]
MFASVLIASVAAIAAPRAVTPLMAAGTPDVQTILTSCGAATDILTKLDSVTVNPYPVVAGKPLSISASGLTTADIVNGAKLKVVVKLGPLPVYSKEKDVCSQPGITCPIPAGQNTINVSQDIPDIVPAGNVNVEVTMTNADGAKIACLNGKIQIVKQ